MSLTSLPQQLHQDRQNFGVVDHHGSVRTVPSRSYRRSGLGGDFSGAARPERKIWVCELEPIAGRPTVISLRNNFSHEALGREIRAFLHRRSEGVTLLDFPFGLATPTVHALGLHSNADPCSVWRAVAACGSPSAFRSRAQAGRTGKGSERPHKRQTDIVSHTPFAPMNLRIYRQTYHGMRLLCELSEAGLPIFPWADAGSSRRGWLGEGCPKSTLIALGLPCTGYKGRGADRLRGRAELLARCEATQALRWADPRLRTAALSDTEGDALDSIILALAAAAVDEEQLVHGRMSARDRPTEGIVYI